MTAKVVAPDEDAPPHVDDPRDLPALDQLPRAAGGRSKERGDVVDGEKFGRGQRQTAPFRPGGINGRDTAGIGCGPLYCRGLHAVATSGRPTKLTAASFGSLVINDFLGAVPPSRTRAMLSTSAA